MRLRSLSQLVSLSVLSAALGACGGGSGSGSSSSSGGSGASTASASGNGSSSTSGSSSPTSGNAGSSTTAGVGGGIGVSTGGLAYPSSGYYLPVLPYVGDNAVGVSLVHPATPTVQYVVSPAGAVVSSSSFLYGAIAQDGTVSLQPSSMAYIQGGVLYDLPLAANGSKPVTSSVAIGATACTLPVDYVPSAVPLAAQLVVTTAGADGICGTADDGQVLVSMAQPFSASTVQNPGYRYLGHLDSSSPSVANVWIEADSAGNLYTDAGGSPQLLRATTGTVPARLYGVSQMLLLQDGGQLATVTYGSGGWQVSAVAGSSGSWTLAGLDSNNFYLYTTPALGSTSWQALALAYGTGLATGLGSGVGTVVNASVSSSQVYLSVAGTTNNYLYSVSESGGSGATLIDTTATTVTDRVYALGSSYQLLSREQQAATGALSWQVNSLGSTGTITALYAGNAVVLNSVVPATYTLGTPGYSQQATFITQAAGAYDYAGAQLETLDSSTGAVTLNGVLPTALELGGSNVYGASGFAYGAGGSLFLGSVDLNGGTGFLPEPEGFYFYNPGAANSLTATTSAE